MTLTLTLGATTKNTSTLLENKRAEITKRHSRPKHQNTLNKYHVVIYYTSLFTRYVGNGNIQNLKKIRKERSYASATL